jgi:hypothetical protein
MEGREVNIVFKNGTDASQIMSYNSYNRTLDIDTTKVGEY